MPRPNGPFRFAVLRFAVLAAILFVSGPVWSDEPNPQADTDVVAAALATLPPDPAYEFEKPHFEGGAIVANLHGLGGDRHVVGWLEVWKHGTGPAHLRHTGSRFDISVRLRQTNDDLQTEINFARLSLAAAAITGIDPGVRGKDGTDPVHSAYLAAALFFVVCLIAVVLVARATRMPLAVLIKPTHVLPAAIQVSILTYWGLYWPEVVDHVPLMAMQLSFAFLLDAVLSLRMRGQWEAGFGPVPVVLSMNLLVWFNQPAVALIVVAASIASKTFFRRGDRPFFNPSVFGLSVGGLMFLLIPGVQFQGLFQRLNIPPNMAEVTLLLSCIPLVRFPLAIIPVGVMSIRGWADAVLQGPDIGKPSMIIALALLSTDPVTIPRTQSARFVYSIFLGVFITLFAVAFNGAHLPDDFSKVYPIFAANLAVPLFDRVGTSRLIERTLNPWVNAGLAAVWLAFIGIRIDFSKGSNFEQELHWNYSTPHVRFSADGLPRCGENPAYCKAFSFGQEMALWRGK